MRDSDDGWRRYDDGGWWWWLVAVVGLCTVALATADELRRNRNVSVEFLPDRPVGVQATPLDAFDYAPYVEIESPLYRAIYDRDSKCCVWIEYTVRAEDVVDDNETRRVWWVPDELFHDQSVLSNVHYRDSGYDRGHLRSIRMSRGSAHWPDVNCLCVVVPEVPELNRGAISQTEARVCELAQEHGWCRVTITLSGDAGDMPHAGSHQIPQTIRYVIESPDGVEAIEYSNLKAEPTLAEPPD